MDYLVDGVLIDSELDEQSRCDDVQVNGLLGNLNEIQRLTSHDLPAAITPQINLTHDACNEVLRVILIEAQQCGHQLTILLRKQPQAQSPALIRKLCEL